MTPPSPATGRGPTPVRSRGQLSATQKPYRTAMPSPVVRPRSFTQVLSYRPDGLDTLAVGRRGRHRMRVPGFEESVEHVVAIPCTP